MPARVSGRVCAADGIAILRRSPRVDGYREAVGACVCPKIYREEEGEAVEVKLTRTEAGRKRKIKLVLKAKVKTTEGEQHIKRNIH